MGENDVPSPPSYVDSTNMSGDDGSQEPDPEKEGDEDDDDDDVFKGEFSREKTKPPDGGLDGIATNAKALLDKFDPGLTQTFPKDLSEPFGSTLLFSRALPSFVPLFL